MCNTCPVVFSSLIHVCLYMLPHPLSFPPSFIPSFIPSLPPSFIPSFLPSLPPSLPPSLLLSLSQVVTEQQLLERSSSLEQALSQQQFSQFCEEKAAGCSSTSEQNIWNFLKVSLYYHIARSLPSALIYT